jgi:hypothetical protein
LKGTLCGFTTFATYRKAFVTNQEERKKPKMLFGEGFAVLVRNKPSQREKVVCFGNYLREENGTVVQPKIKHMIVFDIGSFC